MTDRLQFFSLPGLFHTPGQHIVDQHNRGSGFVFFGNEITDALATQFDKKISPPPGTLSDALSLLQQNDKNRLYSINFYKSNERRDFLAKTREVGASFLLRLNSFFYFSFYSRNEWSSHLWQSYYVQPIPEHGEICGNWIEKAFRSILDPVVLQQLDSCPGLGSISEEFWLPLEQASREVWDSSLHPNLLNLVKEANQGGEGDGLQLHDLLLKLQNFLPPLKSSKSFSGHRQIIGGLSSLASQDERHTQWNAILLLEGYLALNRQPQQGNGYKNQLWAFLAHPLLAYQIARNTKFPKPLPHTRSLKEFAKHYNLDSYNGFQANNKPSTT